MAVLPLIDIGDLRSPSLQAQQLVAVRVDRALRSHGAFLATGHGIPTRILRSGFAEARLLFAVPTSTKAALQADSAGMGRGRGFLTRMAAGDPERFLLGADLPTNHPLVAAGTDGYGPNRWPPLHGFRDAMTSWQRASIDVTELLYGAVALAHDHEEDHLVAHHRCPLVSMVLQRLEPAAFDAAAEERCTPWWSGPGGIAVTMVDGTIDHQVRGRDGIVSVTSVAPNQILVTVGGLLEALTEGRYAATRHRWRLGGEAVTMMTLSNDLDHDTPMHCLTRSGRVDDVLGRRDEATPTVGQFLTGIIVHDPLAS